MTDYSSDSYIFVVGYLKSVLKYVTYTNGGNHAVLNCMDRDRVVGIL